MKIPGEFKFLRWSLFLLGMIAAVLWTSRMSRAQGNQAEPAANPFAQLHFRFVGTIGNRASAITGVPGNPSVAYIGAASGGIFKTTNGGITWFPVFDHEDVSSIGALAVDPADPNVVWAGTGEPWFIRADQSIGDGVYKSTDAGRTWQHMGLDETGYTARVVVDPRQTDTVYVCAIGQTYRPQHERGIFKTTDGGKTWQQVLFVNENAGCSDLAMDPQDSNTLFAGIWPITIHTWNMNSGGPAGGVYVTHDAGATWKKLSGHGLPAADHPLGKTAVAIAPSNPERVYALVEDRPITLYRSDDGGETWKAVNHSYRMADRFAYYTRMAVSPGDENKLYFLNTSWNVSLDGGNTLEPNPVSAGGDLHDIWTDPKDPNYYMVTDDSGGAITWDGGINYRHITLPIAQIYHVYADNQIPYFVYGNRQDGTSYRGPSNTFPANVFEGGGLTPGDWVNTGGCESGFNVPDPVDNNIVWATCYGGVVTRMDLRTGQAQLVSPWPEAAYGVAPADVKYRFHWTTPVTISPEDHNRVYVGSQYLMQTTDGGHSWKVISPDLTLNDKSHQQMSGGITPDQLMTFDGAVVFSIGESPVQAGVIWVGTNDGQVSVTKDGGAHWTNVTKNIPNLPPWGTVYHVEPSPFEAGTAYIVVDLQLLGDYNPYVYKTADFGQSWTSISSNLPHAVLSFAHAIAADPVQKGLLFLGTDNGLYVSFNDGGQWTQLRNNLPPAPVYGLAIQKNFSDLDIATYGRGIYILDDISPLRAWAQAQAAAVYLFKPRPAYRYRYYDETRDAAAQQPVVGENPPYGAAINFYLDQPTQGVQIAMLDAKGQEVRTLTVNGEPGLNRVWWNLEYTPAHTIKLLTSPPGEPWVKVGPEGWREFTGWVSYRGAPRVPPGTYTVRLSAAGKQLTEPLTILLDPHSLGTQQTIEENVAFSRTVLDELNEVVDITNRLEWDRKQAEDLQTMLVAQGGRQGAMDCIQEFTKKASDLEGHLIDIWTTSGGTKEGFREPIQLYGKLAELLSPSVGKIAGVYIGSFAGLPPTAQEVAISQELAQQVTQYRQAFREFNEKEVPSFNSTLKTNGVSAAIQP
jgi:photosystem II stability/assembly factor-like uncharacterized protein